RLGLDDDRGRGMHGQEKDRDHGRQGLHLKPIYLDIPCFASTVGVADKFPNVTGGVGIPCPSLAVPSPRPRRTWGPRFHQRRLYQMNRIPSLRHDVAVAGLLALLLTPATLL